MESDKAKVWDRLKNGVQQEEWDHEEFQRLTREHFDSDEFNRFKEKMREEYFDAMNKDL